MTNDEWIAYLGTLDPALRDALAQQMERINTVIIAHVNRQLDDIQRIERRQVEVRQMIEDLRDALDALRDALDHLRQARAVGE